MLSKNTENSKLFSCVSGAKKKKQRKKKTVHTVAVLTQFLHGVAEIPPGDAPRASTVEFPKQPHQFRFAAAGFPNQLRQFVVQDINDVFTAPPGQVGWGKKGSGKRREGQWVEEKRTVGRTERKTGDISTLPLSTGLHFLDSSSSLPPLPPLHLR